MILYNKEAREKLANGVNTIGNTVKQTIGPMGRNVIIEKPLGEPHITKDGVTVAQAVYSNDQVEDMAIQIIRQAASSTVNTAGDGTTTSTLLAQEMVDYGLELIDRGYNPLHIKNTMNKVLNEVVKVIRSESEQIDLLSERVEQVATISANNDEATGLLIADAIRRVGKEGIVLVEESKDLETTIEHLNGLTFDRGFMSEHFVTNVDKMIVEYNEPLILFADHNIKSTGEFEEIIKACNTNGVKQPLVVICDDIIEQALTKLVTNKMRAGLEIVAIKAPSYGNHRKDLMKDMAIATGGTYISDTNGVSLNGLNSSSQANILTALGQCDKIVVSKNRTTIIGGSGEESEITARINSIKADIENESSTGYISQMKSRIAKLSDGIAVIRVGAATESEMKEKKDRIDDAVAATQAALEEGIIKGGGSLLYDIGISILETYPEDDLKCMMGVCLTKPAEQIMINCGLDGDEIHTNFLKMDRLNGYDALNDKIVNLKEAGIVDPVKVVRTALQNAVSAASTLLTTNVTIVMNKEDRPKDITPFTSY